jgi:hypothetical protein
VLLSPCSHPTGEGLTRQNSKSPARANQQARSAIFQKREKSDAAKGDVLVTTRQLKFNRGTSPLNLFQGNTLYRGVTTLPKWQSGHVTPLTSFEVTLYIKKVTCL